MKIKTTARTLNNNQEILEPDSLIEVEVDLNELEEEIKEYAEMYLDMVDLDDHPCENAELNYFSESEILEYIDKTYGMSVEPFYYPNNSIRTTDAYKTLLDNVDKVPIEEIERLNNKYSL